jgi:hypothetical protein
METYERALDAAMIIAIGKLLLFSTMWGELTPKLEKRNLNAKATEMLRRQLKQIVNGLDDRLFFIAPDQAISEENVKRILTTRIKVGKFTDMVMQRLKSTLMSGQADLAQYL